MLSKRKPVLDFSKAKDLYDLRFLKKKLGEVFSSTGFNVLSLRKKKQGCLCPSVSWSLLGVQASAVVHWTHRAGRGEDGVTRGQRWGGGGWVLANRHLHFSHFPSFRLRNSSTNLFHTDTFSIAS